MQIRKIGIAITSSFSSLKNFDFQYLSFEGMNLGHWVITKQPFKVLDKYKIINLLRSYKITIQNNR